MKMKKTKLQYIQLRLLMHLAQYETLDYLSCLRFLDVDNTNDRTALSYLFRPLTKNDYVAKHKDGSVTILAKGRALCPYFKPLVTLGGGAAGRARVNTVSRTAMFLKRVQIESFAEMKDPKCPHFIPSTCWRKIRPGILSTARFAGILVMGEHRLAVYDIGDGEIEWQMRAERSLFYHGKGGYDTRATGMLLICDDGKQHEIAERIIRMTMWQRKQLISRESMYERDKPVAYVRVPIRAASYYEHVYLATPELLMTILKGISCEKDFITHIQKGNPKCGNLQQGDFEEWPYRYFINIATDLLKYVYFFAAAKELIQRRKEHHSELNYAFALPRRDLPILHMYPDVMEMEGLEVIEHYEY